MIDRQNKGRDTRDGSWLPQGHQQCVPPRRSVERLWEEGWWRMTESYVGTWE